MDPSIYIKVIQLAYVGTSLNVVDAFMGMDVDGMKPYAVVMNHPDVGDIVAFRGTMNFIELLEDVDIIPAITVPGQMTQGVAITYNSLVTASGVPLETYSEAKVTGHSRGANLAAAWAAQYKSPEYCLFAYPRLCGEKIIQGLRTLPGNIFHMYGDPVAGLLTLWPSAPIEKQIMLKATSKSLDPLHYHALSTYEAALFQ